MVTVSRMEDEGRLGATIEERQDYMVEVIFQHYGNGRFPNQCDAFTVPEMEPWMGYAGSVAWYCKTIDPHTVVDFTEDYLGRPFGDWVVEYGINCPLVS